MVDLRLGGNVLVFPSLVQMVLALIYFDTQFLKSSELLKVSNFLKESYFCKTSDLLRVLSFREGSLLGAI